MNTYLKKLLFLPLSLVILTTACTEETLDKCIPGVTISYYYTYNKYDQNLFGKEVDELNILVFDANEKFSQQFRITDPASLLNDNLITLPLAPGNWTILTWGGYMHHYHIGSGGSKNESMNYTSELTPGETSLSDFRLTLKMDTSDTEADYETGELISHLYYGEIKRITTFTDRIVSESIPMIKNTNDVTIRITGIHGIDMLSTDDFKSVIRMSNHRYDADNNNQSGNEDLIYIRDCRIADNAVEFHQRVLRLDPEDKSSYIYIESLHLPGGGLKIPFVKTILENPAYNTLQDLDKEDEYVFEFHVNYDLSVGITINDWKITDVIPEM
ncbi:MAG: FimB/Mfa2 family fimbrial subunit [Bacteroidales bacterium]